MPTVPGVARALAVCLLLGALLGCERAPKVAVELPQDAALAPAVLTPPVEPAGITRFDCTGTEAGQSTQSLRAWKAKGAAGAATNLRGHALACELTLRSDCAGQAELRVSAGLARSEKVVTAVSVDKPVSVALRLTDEAWEKALEPVDAKPYQHTLQLVARAEVSCAAPSTEPRPRYWTDSFIAGLMGAKPRPVASESEEPDVAVKNAPAEGVGEAKPAPRSAPAAAAPSARGASERAVERAARRERNKKAAATLDLNLNPPVERTATVEEPASEE